MILEQLPTLKSHCPSDNEEMRRQRRDGGGGWKCGKQRTYGRGFLEVWQWLDLRGGFSNLWQGKDLAEFSERRRPAKKK
jgi:hypothetical protein